MCHRDMGFLREGEAVLPHIGPQREADRLHERGVSSRSPAIVASGVAVS